MKLFLLVTLLLCSLAAGAAENILNIYGWSFYMPTEVAAQFEQETGIHINYSTFPNNETLYAKLKANPNAGYDLVIPSSYFIDRMARQKMLQKIDKSKLTNIKNLNPDFLNKDFDPHNDYSIPYLWGSTAIVVNTKYYSLGSITSWSDLWQNQYKNQLLLIDDTRDVFSMALLVLGYSPNDTNPEHIIAAYHQLQKLMPNAKLFNTDAMPSIYIDEDATIGMGWSGAIFQASQENPNIHYVYPKEGFSIWIDNLAIPARAQHLENVYKFINFVLRPDIAKKITLLSGFASPNLAAIKLMPADIQQNPILNPDHATLSRGKLQQDVGAATQVYEKYMALLKVGA